MKHLLSLLLMGTLYSVKASVDSYRIFDFENEQMGVMTVERLEKDTILNIRIDSEFLLRKFLYKLRINYTVNTVFHNGLLYSSDILVYKNGRLKSTISTMRKDGHYIFNRNGMIQKPDRVSYPETLMFIREPEDQHSVYSEFNGDQRKIIHKKAHCYEVLDPFGNTYEYEYEKGKLRRATLFYKLVRLNIRRE